MSEIGVVSPPASPPARIGMPWLRGVAWLLFLGPFFFLTYGFANSWAEARDIDIAVVFAWERNIPFLPWTIVPYWSIDLLYGLSFLLCTTPRAVDIHALRLLTAQVISIACFLVLPLHYSFDRPPVDGLFGVLFNALAGFDKPFNQAPSLHIVLLVVLWVRFVEASKGFWRLLTHLWALLIGVSVLTTYQHHFIDLPSGLLVGFLCVWLWPDDAPPMTRQWRLSRSPVRRRIGGRYLMASLACGGLAGLGGWTLWLLWPATAMGLVGMIYIGLGADGFQKRDGRLGIASAFLLAPYRAGAWINSRLWTLRDPTPVEILDGVWLGRMPTRRYLEKTGFHALVDLTAEFSTPRGRWKTVNLPWLDLIAPDREALMAAAEHIERMRGHKTVLVCCALGYSRSAAAVAAWLLMTRRARDVSEAVAVITAHRPNLVLGNAHLESLRALPATVASAHG